MHLKISIDVVLFHFIEVSVYLLENSVEVACSGNVMDCHVMAQGSIPSGNGVKTEVHVLCKGH